MPQGTVERLDEKVLRDIAFQSPEAATSLVRVHLSVRMWVPTSMTFESSR